MVDVMYKVPDASDDDNDEHQHIPEPQASMTLSRRVLNDIVQSALMVVIDPEGPDIRKSQMLILGKW